MPSYLACVLLGVESGALCKPSKHSPNWTTSSASAHLFLLHSRLSLGREQLLVLGGWVCQGLYSFSPDLLSLQALCMPTDNYVLAEKEDGVRKDKAKDFWVAAVGDGCKPWPAGSKQATDPRRGLQKWLDQMLTDQDFPFICELSPTAAPCLSSRCSPGQGKDEALGS